MKLLSMFILGLVFAEQTEEEKQAKKDKRAKKQKDKKSRILRNLRKEAPVILENGKVAFDDDSLAIKCLTSKTKEYKKMGSLSLKQAKIFVCQNWLAEVDRADQYLNEHFQTGLLTDDDIQYDDEVAERGAGFTGWGIGEGPNAKNTVIEFSDVCNKIIPDDHPPYGFNCRGGFVTNDGEVLDHAECRERYSRAEIKRSKKVCRKELRNRAANKTKWWTVDNEDNEDDKKETKPTKQSTIITA